jgi:hypothetical protein
MNVVELAGAAAHARSVGPRFAIGVRCLLLVGGLAACEEAPPPPEPVRRDAGPRYDAYVEACVTVVSRPVVEVVPNDVVDVIVIVDNSGSMAEEAEEVRTGINTFTEVLGGSGLDYRVVLIGAIGAFGTSVCAPPPLGTGPPTCASGPEGRLLPINTTVGSIDAPDVFFAVYPQMQDFLRPGSLRAFLWVTDDNASMSADDFRVGLDYLDLDSIFGATVHHAIVGYHGEAYADWNNPAAGACDSLARVGFTYLSLAQCRDNAGREIPDCSTGAVARVCDRDWSATFAEIARRTESVAIREPVSCTLVPPPAPEGEVLDYSRLSVTYRSGEETTLLRHATSGRCVSGWQFDDESSPTAIVLCPDVCRRVQSDRDAELEVAVACYEDPT